MMKKAATFALGMTLLLGARGAARADAPEASASRPSGPRAMSLGFRVGGYGFRNTTHEGKGRWDDCRMDGAGIFGQLGLGEHLFAEAGLDLYSAKNPEAMDRLSGLATVAAGARANIGRFSPYVQLGAGLEATRARHGHREDRALAPIGFLGLGFDVRVYRRLHGGAVFRTNVMRHYLHDHSTDAMRADYEAANQGQFFLSYEL